MKGAEEGQKKGVFNMEGHRKGSRETTNEPFEKEIKLLSYRAHQRLLK